MSALNKKLLRDLAGNLGLLATVIVIIAVGAGSFIGMGSTQRIVASSQEAYYRNYRFADFWINVKKAPLTVVPQLAGLDGIGRIEGRVVFDVILDVRDEVRPIHGRLISTPARPSDRTLNDICLVRGSDFSDDRDEEVILGEAFAKAHGLSPGDRISLLLNRKHESFVIVGTAISPEYVYMVRGAGDLLPDPKHFGILFIRDDFARDVLDFQGACNQITGRFTINNANDQEFLLDRMERMLDPYGVIEMTPRDRQASHRFLSDEIRGLGINATMLPALFLSVAALVLNILMGRLAERQRTIVGTLKALGYSNRSMLLHFLAFGAIVGVAGGVCGIAFGQVIVGIMLTVYQHFFEFPEFLVRVYPGFWLLGLAVSVAFTIGGTLNGARKVLRLQPAEAMRQKPPPRGGAIWIERFRALWNRLDFRTRMAFRGVFRHRARSLTTIFATTISTSIVLMTLMLSDSVFYLVDFEFGRIVRSDVDIGMHDERSVEAIYEAHALPAVDYVEGVLGVTCDLRNGRKQRRISISGLPPVHRLTVPRAADGTPIDIPSHGLALSDKLARMLDLRIGDEVELTPVRGRKRTVHVPISSIVTGYLGLSAYADRRYLSSLVGEVDAVNAVQASVNEAEIGLLFRAIKQLPNAQGLSVRADSRAAIESTFVKSMSASLLTTIILAGVIAFGSILNTTRIEVAERERDIATFRTLGYRPAQIAGIFFRQNLLLCGVGILFAIPAGYGLVAALVHAYDTELYRMPLVVHGTTVVKATLIAIGFVAAAQWFVYRSIAKLDWRAGIQVKE